MFEKESKISLYSPPSLTDTAKIQGSYSVNRNSKRIKNRGRCDGGNHLLPSTGELGERSGQGQFQLKY